MSELGCSRVEVHQSAFSPSLKMRSHSHEETKKDQLGGLIASPFVSWKHSLNAVWEQSSNLSREARRIRKKCIHPGCERGRRGAAQLCIAHGGGSKCSVLSCASTSKERGLCKLHGGGKRCTAAGCTKSAQQKGLCTVHGGGRLCKHIGCTKLAKAGGRCIGHGGGTRCSTSGCNNATQSGGLCKGECVLLALNIVSHASLL